MKIWFQVFAPAICYFLFNWQFFRCVESALPVKPLRIQGILFTFILNYSAFYACSALRLHLIANWLIFLLLLLVEQLILYRLPLYKCALFALLGTQLGLAANILFRSLTAIVLDLPLIFFDNNVSAPGNMKTYPILLGFLAVGVAFLLTAHFKLLKRLDLALESRNTAAFLLGLLTAIYFYLCMNLIIYYTRENNLALKLWSMKSSIFVIVGECLSVILSIRLGEIAAYREKSQKSQQQLAEERARENELHAIASTDSLLGCENRLQAIPRLEKALESGRVFCLGFVDLNGLKAVNDGFGHEMGDAYIQSVFRALKQACKQGSFLFRYGGDEFILLLYDTTASEACTLLQQAQQRLDSQCRSKAYPFSMGFSYGIAVPGEDGAEAQELIKAADARMYQMKLSARR